MNIKRIRNSFAIFVLLIIVVIGSTRVYAVESEELSVDIGENKEQSVYEDESSDQSTEAVGSIVLPTDEVEQDIISVDLPILQEDGESPFNFIIDPQNLLFETNAALYGGGVVEEGANLLFHNCAKGEFDFSRYSDSLCVTNRSTVPVMVTISAEIMDVNDLKITQNKNFLKDDLPYVYLALVDDKGSEQPVSEDGEVSINATMQRAPQNAYVYTLDSETGNYAYGLSGTLEDIDFDTYTFGLTGECNPNADWSNISVHPKIKVTWHVEPILEEKEREESMIEEGRITEKKQENAVEKEELNGISEEDDSNEGIPNKDDVNKDIDESATDKKKK